MDVASNAHKGQVYFSRYLAKRHLLPHPAKGLNRYHRSLEDLLAHNTYQVILPMNDYTSLGLVECKVRRRVGVPLPSAEALRRAGNKAEIADLGKRLGLGVPTTLRASNPQELDAALDQIGYPCVVKLNRGAGSVGMSILHQPSDLDRSVLFFEDSSALAYDRQNLLVQEYIPGEIHDVCLLFQHGHCCGGLTQRRVRMYPPGAGIGVVVETTHEPELMEQSVAMLSALDWHGPAQVEFKRDERDGSARLLEINGRFWGTLDHCIQSGFHVPELACRVALEQKVEVPSHFPIGARYRWTHPYGLLSLLRGEPFLNIIRDFFLPHSGAHNDLWLSDPIPHLAEVIYALKRMAARGFTITKTPTVLVDE